MRATARHISNEQQRNTNREDQQMTAKCQLMPPHPASFEERSATHCTNSLHSRLSVSLVFCCLILCILNPFSRVHFSYTCRRSDLFSSYTGKETISAVIVTETTPKLGVSFGAKTKTVTEIRSVQTTSLSSVSSSDPSFLFLHTHSISTLNKHATVDATALSLQPFL